LLHHASFALTSAPAAIANAYRWRPNLIFTVAPSLMSSALIAPLARRVRASSWLHIQDFEVDAAFDLGLLRNKYLREMMLAAERRILRSFDAVSTISPQMLQRLKNKGVNNSRLFELRNWIDTSKITPGNRRARFRDELKLTDSNIVVLYAGTMSNKQGLDLIIEAAKAIDGEHATIQFILCGDGPHKSALQELAAGMTNVHFLALQSDDRFAQLLNTADIHVIPQRAEAADLVLPSKLGGIFASGRPVITMAAADTGLAEEVEGAGFVVPPGDVRALVTAVQALAEQAELRHRLGENARRRAMDRWDKTKMLKSLEHDLKAVAGQK